MKLYLITPTEHLNFTHLLPGQFCIASIAQCDTVYREYYKNCLRSKTPLILDSGVFEGDEISEKDYLEVVKEIKPDIVVAYDEIGASAGENYDRAVAFGKALHEMCSKEEHRPPELMFVPQCKSGDFDGFWDSVETAAEDTDFEYLGICRDACSNAYQKILGTDDQELLRFIFGAEWLRRDLDKQTGTKLHYLGIGDRVEMLQYYWYVDSMDTASFFWQAACGNTINPDGNLKTQWKRPFNYFELTFPELNKTELYSRVKFNCYEAKRYAYMAEQLKRQLCGKGRI